MTKLQWSDLKIGDVIIERRSGARRQILELSRNSRCGLMRTCITMRNLVYPEKLTIYFSSDDTRGKRWRLCRS